MQFREEKLEASDGQWQTGRCIYVITIVQYYNVHGALQNNCMKIDACPQRAYNLKFNREGRMEWEVGDIEEGNKERNVLYNSFGAETDYGLVSVQLGLYRVDFSGVKGI